MIRFVLDPALNLYFDLTIRGTDTVCIDWTLHVPLSFKWVEQESSHQLFENWFNGQMERSSVLEMLSDKSSAPTLLGCRPSARKSLGRSQKRFQLLTKSSF